MPGLDVVGSPEVKIAIIVRHEAFGAVLEAERLLGFFSVRQLPLDTREESLATAKTIQEIHLECLSVPNSGQIGDTNLLARRLRDCLVDFTPLLITSESGRALDQFWDVTEKEYGAPIVERV